MALATGSKLGPYELTAAIGAGGMGEVYRARDPRLSRDVAVKVMPSSYSSDPQRLRRFEQEALAAATLNHPNILAVYDIGTHDGFPYIVSELLEGETLRERLKSGPLTLRKALDYAIQIARGLAVAHDKGVVHRDLKPENIFLTRDGRLKLLDFGLAKLTQSSAPFMDSETRTVQNIESDAGTVLGTMGYISPEQLRGNPADARSDLFAFGAVLYEMISGKRAFHGETPTDTMSAILHNDPPELLETVRNVPPALDRVVRHCLEKSPEERIRSAHDLAFELEALASLPSPAPRALTAVKRRHILVAVMVAAIVALVAGFLAGRYHVSQAMVIFRRITYERGSVVQARFAPDGHSVIYEAAWEGKSPRLFSTPSTVPEPRPLDLEDTHLFGISRAGEAAVGLGGRLSNHLMVVNSTLARSPLGGGAPRELLQNVIAADWAPDGSLAVAHRANGRMRLEYPVGKVLYETSGWISDLRFSPKGDQIAFLDHPFWPDDRGSVAEVDLAGNEKTLSPGWEAEDGLAWAPDGKEVWFTAVKAGIDRSLFAVTLEGKQRLLLSVPGSLRLYDIYPDGRVLLSAGHERVSMNGVSTDNKARDLSWSGWTIAMDMSPDGKWVLFNEESEFAGPNYTVAIRKTDGSPPVKLGDGITGKFSPDGKWVTAVTPGHWDRVTLLPTGAGDAKEVAISGLEMLQEVGFVPDGRLLVTGSERGQGVRCYTMNLDGGAIKAVTNGGSRFCRVSPNSRSIASGDSAGTISVYPLRGGAAQVLPNSAGMFPVVWLDDDTILAMRAGEIPGRVFQIRVADGKQRSVRDLIPSDVAGVSQLQSVVASRDARSFAYSYQQVLYELYVVEGLR